MRRTDEQLQGLYEKRNAAFEIKNWSEQKRYQGLIDEEQLARWNESFVSHKDAAPNTQITGPKGPVHPDVGQ